MPTLRKPHINAEISIAADVIALPGLTSVSGSKRIDCRGAIGKNIRRPGVEVDAGFDGSDLVGVAFQFEVCREVAETIVHRDRETARQAEQARELPAADQPVQQTVRLLTDRTAAAEGQFKNPIGVELVRRVKRRNAFLRGWIPRINDVVVQPEEAPVTRGANAFRVGGDVDGFREGVVEIKLETAAHTMPERNFQGVVIGPGDRAPSVQRAELRRVVGVLATGGEIKLVGIVVIRDAVVVQVI